MSKHSELQCEVCFDYFRDDLMSKHYIDVHEYDEEVAYDTTTDQLHSANHFDEWDQADHDYNVWKELSL